MAKLGDFRGLSLEFVKVQEVICNVGEFVFWLRLIEKITSYDFQVCPNPFDTQKPFVLWLFSLLGVIVVISGKSKSNSNFLETCHI